MAIKQGEIIYDFFSSLFTEVMADKKFEVSYIKYAFDPTTRDIFFFEGSCIRRKDVNEGLFFHLTENKFFFLRDAQNVNGKRRPLKFDLDSKEADSLSSFITTRMKEVASSQKNQWHYLTLNGEPPNL